MTTTRIPDVLPPSRPGRELFQTTGDSETGGIAFTGGRGALARLLTANALLILVTGGIYRFWAKTRERRYFWNNVSIMDDPLEYTGTPMELFIGFMIVLLILVPLSMIQGGIGEPLMMEYPTAGIIFNFTYFFILVVLMQVGFYRMWRYRLTRTTWRGVRFGLDGSTWVFVGKAIPWILATILTLGFAYPWMRIAMARYRLDNTRFGNTRFSLDCNARDLIGVWGATYAVLILLVGASTVGGAVAENTAEAGGLAAVLGVVSLLMVLVLLLMLVWYRVREFRLVANRLRFGDATFDCRIATGAVIRATVVTGVMVALPMGALFAFVAVPLVAMEGGGNSEVAVMMMGGMFVGFVFMIIVLPVVVGVFFRHALVRAVCETTTIMNPGAFHAVAQSSDTGPKYGEGLADAFDVGAF